MYMHNDAVHIQPTLELVVFCLGHFSYLFSKALG